MRVRKFSSQHAKNAAPWRRRDHAGAPVAADAIAGPHGLDPWPILGRAAQLVHLLASSGPWDRRRPMNRASSGRRAHGDRVPEVDEVVGRVEEHGVGIDERDRLVAECLLGPGACKEAVGHGVVGELDVQVFDVALDSKALECSERRGVEPALAARLHAHQSGVRVRTSPAPNGLEQAGSPAPRVDRPRHRQPPQATRAA